MNSTTHSHATIYGIPIDSSNTKVSLIKLNPQWKQSQQPPHWVESESTDLGMKMDLGAKKVEAMFDGGELDYGIIFPDGSILENLMEKGTVRNPQPENIGQLCYIGGGGPRYFGVLLLYDGTPNEINSSPPGDLLKRLYDANETANLINQFGFETSAEELQVLQRLFKPYHLKK